MNTFYDVGSLLVGFFDPSDLVSGVLGKPKVPNLDAGRADEQKAAQEAARKARIEASSRQGSGATILAGGASAAGVNTVGRARLLGG